jgi:Holliday junction DNA helicase RuvB
MIQDLRPRTFEEVVGQNEVMEYLKLKVESCNLTGRPPGHILMLGPPGSGKSTLAHVFAHEMDRKIKSIAASRMDRPEKIMSVIMELEPGDVLFFDEIHALSPKNQEQMYDWMEDFKADVFVGPPRNVRPVTMDLPRFTLIGATTHAGDLNGPLLRRFSYHAQLSPYTIDDLNLLVRRANARIYEDECPMDVAQKIAELSRKSASNAVSLLQNYREILAVKSLTAPMDVLSETVRLGKLDPWIGLDYQSRKYITALAQRRGQSIGLDRLSSIISEQPDTIKWVIEPFMLSMIEFEGQRGQMVEIDRAGRRATDLADYYVYYCKWHQQSQGMFPGEYFG